MSKLRLVVFDVDGTLVDSQDDIVAAMQAAYTAVDKTPPTRSEIRQIVGLSLEVAFLRLSSSNVTHLDAMIDGYKNAYIELRARKGTAESSPLFPDARATLEALHSDPWTILAVATGKSKRGLDKLIEGHELHGMFASCQVADFHPSKPHPSMLHAALSETGVAPQDAVMIGDTSYDMKMAKAAGLHAIGVGWGYHDRSALSDADLLIDDFNELPAALTRILEPVK